MFADKNETISGTKQSFIYLSIYLSMFLSTSSFNLSMEYIEFTACCKDLPKTSIPGKM